MAISSIDLSKLRMTGMSSSLDTDGIIKSLMQIEQMKLDRQLRSRTTLQWKQDALNGITTMLSDFRSKFFSAMSPDSISSENTYNAFKATVTNDDNAISASTTVHAKAGTVVIDKVKQIAKGAHAESVEKISADGSYSISDTNNTKLGDLKFKNSLFGIGENEISFSVNGRVFKFNKDDTLQKMLDTVSNDELAGVNMKYDRMTDSISFETKELGSDSVLMLTNIKGNAFGNKNETVAGLPGNVGAFGIDIYGSTSFDETTGELSFVTDIKDGQNAVIVVNGREVERDTNTFEVDGIVFTLNRPTEKSTTVSVTRDATNAVEKIKNFVNAYNELVSKLSGYVNDRKTTEERKYIPLTDTERDAMSDTEIEAWEKIAKKGVLNRDAGLDSMLRKMRKAVYDSVESAGVSPSSIGLKMSPYSSTKNGQIELDETKLREALEKDPEKVMNVLSNLSDSKDSLTAYNNNGLSSRLSSIFNQYTTGSNIASLNSVQRVLDQTNTKITQMNKKMTDQQERLYLKYAAMEEALSKMQSQSAWIGANMM